ncbi:MAG TPA: hemolysin family protein, partial [Candidatus Synoicihabitans sp.]|nr:hemolysin family protein [Candidatus Synoicihabitans sp.]
MNDMSNEVLVVLLLLLAHGIFAMAEAALGAARKSRLKELADDGNSRAAQALELLEDPGRFAATVRVAMTIAVVLAGALAADDLTAGLAVGLARVSWLAGIAHPLALALVVIAITFASVIVGDLMPKRLAIHGAERVMLILLGPINALTRLIAPIVRVLTFLTDLALRPLGLHGRPKEAPVTEEEVNNLIEQGLTAGVFNKSERDMVAGVLELDQLPVTALMTPRPKMIFLNLDDSDEVNWRKVVASGHSHFPVYQGNRDQVVGMVSVKSIWANNAFGIPTHLRHLLTPPLIVPETMMAHQLLEQFKKHGRHTALVADEFGSVQGIVTLFDVLEAIVGDLPEPGQRRAPEARQREDGSWLVDATLSTDELKALIAVDELPHEDEVDFQTLGGFVMTQFGRIPTAGD